MNVLGAYNANVINSSLSSHPYPRPAITTDSLHSQLLFWGPTRDDDTPFSYGTLPRLPDQSRRPDASADSDQNSVPLP